MKLYFFLSFTFLIAACQPTIIEEQKLVDNKQMNRLIDQSALVVLGTVQDAGSPHIACKKECCRNLFLNADPNRKVVSLGLVDPKSQKKYIVEASPDLPTQMKLLKSYTPSSTKETPDGVFLTHAHIGHYTGLMYFGKEAMNAPAIPVYAMPRMKTFLENNGPWSQLVQQENISLQAIKDQEEVELSTELKVIPFRVPHRDEYSETVGYTIVGPSKRALFIPDIDKWEKWEADIIEAIATVDYAFLDGTFYDAEEINHRDIAEIPHPFIIESMEKFKDLPEEEKKKIYFIHFNHTNPVLNEASAASKNVAKLGFNIARMHQVFAL